MAGLGIELTKLFSKPSYSSVLKAYGYAGLIGCGPWLMAFFSLGLLGLVLPNVANAAEVRLFFVSVSSIYGLTLILTGPVQVILTRYAADQQFNRCSEQIIPAFLASMSWVALAFAAIGLILFVGYVPAPLLFQLSAALLMVLIAPIWISTIFLTAVKNYHRVLVSFAIGFALSLTGGWLLASRLGIGGAMLGVALGHGLLLALLCGAIFREIPSAKSELRGYLPYFTKYWDLALCGLFYNLGIWIDKFLYWWADPAAQHVSGLLRTSPVFDRVVYFSFLSVVPGMAVFLLKLETELSLRNRTFYQLVLKKGTLRQLQEAKLQLAELLRNGLLLLLKVQGLVTGLLIIFAGKMLDRLGLGAAQASIFQIALLGVFLLVAFLGVLTTLYYFDKHRQAMVCCLVFLLVNSFVTLWTISAGDRWYGFGILTAAGVALILATSLVNHDLESLEFETFTSQPLYE